MKNSKEMADSVFEIRNAYLEKQKKKRARAAKAAYLTAAVGIFAVTVVSTAGIFLPVGKQPAKALPDTSDTFSRVDEITSANSAIPTETTAAPRVTSAAYSYSSQTQTDILSEAGSVKPTETTSNSSQELIEATESEYSQPEVSVAEPTVTEPAVTETTTTPKTDESSTAEENDTHNTVINTVDNSVQTEEVTVNFQESEALTAGELYSRFPEIMLEKKYLCENRTAGDLSLENVIIKTELMGNDGGSILAVIYSLDDENNEIAVQFYGLEDCIIYRAE